MDQKMGIWGDFQVIFGVTRGESGRGSKNWKIWVTSYMDDQVFNYEQRKQCSLNIENFCVMKYFMLGAVRKLR